MKPPKEMGSLGSPDGQPKDFVASSDQSSSPPLPDESVDDQRRIVDAPSDQKHAAASPHPPHEDIPKVKQPLNPHHAQAFADEKTKDFPAVEMSKDEQCLTTGEKPPSDESLEENTGACDTSVKNSSQHTTSQPERATEPVALKSSQDESEQSHTDTQPSTSLEERWPTLFGYVYGMARTDLRSQSNSGQAPSDVLGKKCFERLKLYRSDTLRGGSASPINWIEHSPAEPSDDGDDGEGAPLLRPDEF